MHRPRHNERNRQIINAFFLGKTYEVIGKEFSVTRQRAFQIVQEFQQLMQEKGYCNGWELQAMRKLGPTNEAVHSVFEQHYR